MSIKTVHGESIPCSIATAMALEGAFGIHPELKVRGKPIEDYDRLYINLYTLIRNAWGSIDDDLDFVKPEDVVALVNSDIDIIKGYIADNITNPFTIEIYFNDFDVVRMYPKAKAKLPTTEKQLADASRQNEVLKQLLENPVHEVRTYDGKIMGDGDALIITHRPYDLFSRYEFKTLSLLESHTGKVKRYSEFGTKLGIKDSTYPFHMFTVIIFGDGQDFAALSPKLKRTVKEMAALDNWNVKTTTARIRASIDKLPNSDVKTTLIEIIKSI